MLTISAIIILSIILGVISCTLFIIEGGYIQQIDTLRQNGLSLRSLDQTLTNGRIDIYVNIYFYVAIIILLTLSLFLAYSLYVTENHGIKKIVMFVLIAVILLACISAAVLLIFFPDVIEQLPIINRSTGNESTLENINIPIIVGFAISLIALITSVIMMFKQYREICKRWIVALLISLLIVPAVLLIVKNIIPLAITAVICLLLWLVFKIIGGLVSESGEGSSSGESRSSAKASGGNDNSAKDPPKKAGEPKIYNVSNGVKLFRAENLFGAMWIKRDNGISGEFEVCSAEDFDTGKAVIMRGGKKVTVI